MCRSCNSLKGEHFLDLRPPWLREVVERGCLLELAASWPGVPPNLGWVLTGQAPEGAEPPSIPRP